MLSTSLESPEGLVRLGLVGEAWRGLSVVARGLQHDRSLPPWGRRHSPEGNTTNIIILITTTRPSQGQAQAPPLALASPLV